MDAKTQHGYLVIADISGFTSYLATVELEHAHEILTDLLETIVRELKTLLTTSKLEGDAVFAYAPETDIPRGERILEAIEKTYDSFRQQRETSRRNTTCNCKACQSIPTLEMKNHVTAKVGWSAYLLLTGKALQHMEVQPEGLHRQLESYEHLGEIEIFSLDLHERYKAIKEAKRTLVALEEAEYFNTFDFNAAAWGEQSLRAWESFLENCRAMNRLIAQEMGAEGSGNSFSIG